MQVSDDECAMEAVERHRGMIPSKTYVSLYGAQPGLWCVYSLNGIADCPNERYHGG